ncbi:MAG: YidC/Oxa1 family membrane protein insertase [Candidatus Peregrinibacteria bacterium]|nr:YidC/Oxa1 family membrane protein insertase [Candidatus Peregrinibacteria bacterium]
MQNKVKEFAKSFLIWFAVFYLVILGIEKFFGPPVKGTELANSKVQIESIKDSFVIGNYPQFEIKNELSQKVSFSSPCDTSESLKIFRIVNGQNVDISTFEGCDQKSVKNFSLEPNDSIDFDFRDFTTENFTENGDYMIEMTFNFGENETEVSQSNKMEFSSPGIFRQLFRAIVSRPLFNLIVFFTEVLPGHSFGAAIIMLTIFVRILLFIPNQKAMKSQREMQKLQPKLEELKRKHGKNQQLIAMKTMELYKSHKVNPMSSCLPMLFQMPFLIGVYMLVRDGLSPNLSYLLYGFHQDFDFSIADFDFLIWQLEEIDSLYILPVIVAVAQFLAVKLSMISAAKKKAKSDKPVVKSAQGDQMAQMQKMMLYVMPLMIGFFTATFPSGVGIYWLTSTVFGIGQQKLVNWQLDKPQVRRKER